MNRWDLLEILAAIFVVVIGSILMIKAFEQPEVKTEYAIASTPETRLNKAIERSVSVAQEKSFAYNFSCGY